MKRALHYLIFFLSLIQMFSCGPRSLQDYRREGESITQEIMELLYTIDTREDAVRLSPRLKSLFDQLVNVMISAIEFREKHPEDDLSPPDAKGKELSRRLQAELIRVYRIEDVRDIIEKCQEDALNRLDAYEKHRKIKGSKQ